MLLELVLILIEFAVMLTRLVEIPFSLTTILPSAAVTLSLRVDISLMLVVTLPSRVEILPSFVVALRSIVLMLASF